MVQLVIFLTNVSLLHFKFYSIVIDNCSLTFLSSLDIRIQYEMTSSELPALCAHFNHRNYSHKTNHSHTESKKTLKRKKRKAIRITCRGGP
jgi:hypothetical protein